MELKSYFGLMCTTLALLGVNAGNDANNGGMDDPGYQVRDGDKMVFTSILFEPYLMENDDKSATGNDRYVGFIADLVKELARRLDLEYELKLVDDGKWGSRDSQTGHWNGMIGEVISNKAQMAVAPITMTALRKTMVEFTAAFQNVSITALVKSDSPYTTLEEIIADKNMTQGCIAMGSTANQFKSDRQYASLWSQMESKDSFVSTSQEGVDKVLKGNFAFFMEKPTARYEVAKDCRLKAVGEILRSDGYAFPVNKNNPNSRQLRENVDKALSAMKKDGKLQEIENMWWTPKPERMRQETCGAPVNINVSFVLLLSTLIFSYMS